MRFLHLADIHLDTLFRGRSGTIRDRLRTASHEALRRAVGLAVERKVDAVLVAGDLFDGERLSFRTERFLVEQVGRLADADIPFLYATGNHDPGRASVGGGRIAWPPNVEIFAHRRPRTVGVRRDGSIVGTVTAAGHETDRESADLSRAFPASDAARREAAGEGEAGGSRALDRIPAVAMLHTQVTGAGGAEAHDRYAPSELPHLRESGYDYWALGHIHRRGELARLPSIRYPGNLQGRHFGETGPLGGLLVELPASGVAADVQFVELAPVRFERLTVDGIVELGRFDDLVRHIGNAWSRERDRDPGLPDTRWMIRVELEGASPLAGEFTDEESRRALADELAAELDALDVELRTDRVRSSVDPAEYRERTDPAGAALRLLEGIDDRGAAGRLLERLEMAPGELAGVGDEPPAEYVARILGQGTGEQILIDRFRREGADS